jgi:hypothetical protein
MVVERGGGQHIHGDLIEPRALPDVVRGANAPVALNRVSQAAHWHAP